MSKIASEGQNMPAELLEPSDYGEYLLHNRIEILQVLRQLQDRNCQITVFFNEGDDLILTTLLSVGDDGLVFDYGPVEEINKRAESVVKFFCITQLDKVRVQFILKGLKTATYKGLPAFRADLPESLLRLQRREYYRLTMPVTRRLTCQIPHDNGQTIEVEIVDLSGGGLALVLPKDGLDVEPDREFSDCHIELPETGSITANIKVLTVFEITLRNGNRVKRAGCRFIDMPGTMTNKIQRYIIRIERERKARESGLE